MSRYIDADELQKRMLNYYAYSRDLCEEIKGFFERTRTADIVEVVHGEWKESCIGAARLVKCTACGMHWVAKDIPHTNDGKKVAWNYCPICGADMRGGEQ